MAAISAASRASAANPSTVFNRSSALAFFSSASLRASAARSSMSSLRSSASVSSFCASVTEAAECMASETACILRSSRASVLSSASSTSALLPAISFRASSIASLLSMFCFLVFISVIFACVRASAVFDSASSTIFTASCALLTASSLAATASSRAAFASSVFSSYSLACASAVSALFLESMMLSIWRCSSYSRSCSFSFTRCSSRSAASTDPFAESAIPVSTLASVASCMRCALAMASCSAARLLSRMIASTWMALSWAIWRAASASFSFSRWSSAACSSLVMLLRSMEALAAARSARSRKVSTFSLACRTCPA
mmetsp:Transcript_40548/g.82902  ORF Transcript_40548/g.82902 Transcript_40548/m.82902 type:complete len:315 (+) Transcript_40548:313-1257(+)